MPRLSKPLTLIRAYEPDEERCARALVRLLLWEPPTTPPEGQAGTDSAPEEPPCPDHADHQDEHR